MDNADFNLTEDELLRLNAWTESIARAMGTAEIESWTINVQFTFSNMGTGIVANCGSSNDSLTIREEW
jgi:hypothetical protein